MSQVEKIFQGFKNLIFKDEAIEKDAEVKLKICFECPFKKETVGIWRCGKCSCALIAKARSPQSKCPDNRW